MHLTMLSSRGSQGTTSSPHLPQFAGNAQGTVGNTFPEFVTSVLFGNVKIMVVHGGTSLENAIQMHPRAVQSPLNAAAWFLHGVECRC